MISKVRILKAWVDTIKLAWNDVQIYVPITGCTMIRAHGKLTVQLKFHAVKTAISYTTWINITSYYNNKPINLLNYFYIPSLATCPEGDGYTDQDDLEIYCGEEACQPCTPGKRNVYFTYFLTKNTLYGNITLGIAKIL